jgi:hypothetical protein
MAERVQVLLEPQEKARLQRRADLENTSLSAWMRKAALDRLAELDASSRFQTPAQLRDFFKRCAARERGQGPEPDWNSHRDVIEQSRRTGTTRT